MKQKHTTHDVIIAAAPLQDSFALLAHAHSLPTIQASFAVRIHDDLLSTYIELLEYQNFPPFIDSIRLMSAWKMKDRRVVV